MHLKRNKFANFWPIPRKGKKYLALANHNQNESMPLVIVLRDILKLVKNKKELKRALNEKQISVNHKIVKETNYPICLLDIFSVGNLHFKANLSESKKMVFEEIKADKADTRIYKVLNKKKIGKNKIQLNLSQGKNIISEEKVEVGDSVLINLKNNKIVNKISLEKGKIAFTIKGKHLGKTGKILDIVERGGKKIVKIDSKGKRINVWVKNIILIE